LRATKSCEGTEHRWRALRASWYPEISFRADVDIVVIDDLSVRIYSPEKAIADCGNASSTNPAHRVVRFRNYFSYVAMNDFCVGWQSRRTRSASFIHAGIDRIRLCVGQAGRRAAKHIPGSSSSGVIGSARRRSTDPPNQLPTQNSYLWNSIPPIFFDGGRSGKI